MIKANIPVLQRFNEVITSQEDFETLIWDPLLIAFPNAEFLDETKTFYTKEQIYFYLNTTYGNRYLRYETTTFINYVSRYMVQALPNLYLKQIAWINQELDSLKDVKNRGPFDINNSSESGEPFNSTNEDLSDTDSVARKVRDKRDRYNIVDDLELIMNAQFDFAMNSFVAYFNELFTIYDSIPTYNIYNDYDI